MVLADPRRAELKLARAMDELVGAETTSSLAIRHAALAAINGGYFRTTGTYRGDSVGVLILAGKILSEPERRRAALAVRQTSNKLQAAIANVDLSAELLIGRQSYPINGFNRTREQDDLIVFTPEFHRTTLTTPAGLEAIVRRSRTTAILDGKGSQMIPADGFVISAAGKAREWLRANLQRGRQVRIKTALLAEPDIPFSADFVIGGGPRLLAGGQSVAAGEAGRYSESLFQQRHPRTAFGWRKDGTLVLVAVDGRQPQTSVGMTIAELTQLMSELECTDAINLDGGGSTTMVIRNQIVNKPSDPTGERPVSDALLLYAKAK